MLVDDGGHAFGQDFAGDWDAMELVVRVALTARVLHQRSPVRNQPRHHHPNVLVDGVDSVVGAGDGEFGDNCFLRSKQQSILADDADDGARS